MVNAPRATPITRYVALAIVAAMALVYQARYTVYRAPTWFGLHVVAYPFFVFPAADKPDLVVYLGHPVADIGNGDAIVAVNGRRLRGTAGFGEALSHSRPGDQLTVAIRSSNGQPRTVIVPLRAETSPPASSVRFWLELFLFVLFPWFCLVLGFWVVAVRIGDLRAWLLLALMLSFAGFFSPGTDSWEPWLRDVAMGYHVIVADFLTMWLFLLGIYFPEPFPSESRWNAWTRWKWIIIVPLVCEAACDAITFSGAMENYESVFSLRRLITSLRGGPNTLDLIAVICMWLCLAAKLRLATSQDAKRRVRVLVAGALVSLAPVSTLAVASHLLGVEMEQYFPDWLTLPAWVLFFLFPLTLAYVIVVHRAMGVRVVIRQGLRYAMARRGVRILRALFGMLLAFVVLSLLNRVGRSVLYYVIIAAAIAVWIWFRRLVQAFGAWVDRRFFREAYNAEQLLAELSERVRSIVEARPLLATVAERISQSLHVPQIAVLTNGSGPYRATYALGFEQVPSVTFPHDAGTVRQLRESREAARVYLDDPNSWVYRTPGVSEEERARLNVLRSELLLPLSIKDELLGFISLSQKRSEEPYSPTDVRLLESVAAQTGLALQVARLTTAVGEEVARRERMSRELEIAREVQERLFPQQPPEVDGLDYCGACRPALGVGGDYYDFLPLAGDRLGIALGDVSGKGIAAALMMASLQASLRAEASRAVEHLGPMIGEVNRLLYEASTQNRYATFFYAQYEPVSRKLTYVNAGHNAPMLFKGSQPASKVIRLDAGGPVIGLLKSFTYSDASVVLEPGDLLVIYTDGITETMTAADEEWGEEGLMRAVEECRHSCSREMLSHIMQAADAFAAGAEQHDDMTLVVLRVTN